MAKIELWPAGSLLLHVNVPWAHSGKLEKLCLNYKHWAIIILIVWSEIILLQTRCRIKTSLRTNNAPAMLESIWSLSHL